MLGGSPIYWAECTERKGQKGGGGGGGEWVSSNPILAFFISWAVAVYAWRSGHRLFNRELFGKLAGQRNRLGVGFANDQLRQGNKMYPGKSPL